jgi:hypothetical protein
VGIVTAKGAFSAEDIIDNLTYRYKGSRRKIYVFRNHTDCRFRRMQMPPGKDVTAKVAEFDTPRFGIMLVQTEADSAPELSRDL